MYQKQIVCHQYIPQHAREKLPFWRECLERPSAEAKRADDGDDDDGDDDAGNDKCDGVMMGMTMMMIYVYDGLSQTFEFLVIHELVLLRVEQSLKRMDNVFHNLYLKIFPKG